MTENTTHNDLLNIAATVDATRSEGPGNRYALWVQGCTLRCAGCCNPEMLAMVTKRLVPATQLADKILTLKNIEGVSFLGGEPLLQAPALAVLAKRLRKHGLSVMLFTGYTYRHIRRQNDPHWNALLAQTDLLVSGPYLRRQHSSRRRWIGSDNQEIHYLSERYVHLSEEAQGWDPGRNSIDITYRDGTLTVNGFPAETLEDWRKSLAGQK